MGEKFVFADEAGCFTFKRNTGASRYFILCTLAVDRCEMSGELLDLRRRLILRGDLEREKLHASEDSQHVRDAVFAILNSYPFRVDATILEKSKAQPHTRTEESTFYRYAWHYHLKFVGPLLLRDADKLLITAASIGTRKTKASFKVALNNAVQATTSRSRWEASFLDSSMDPLLWAADYCAWAIQRKWERNDQRSYELVKSKIATEFDLWREGDEHYY